MFLAGNMELWFGWAVKHQPLWRKVACAMFTVLLLFSFLIIGIVTGLNFKKNSHENQTRGLLSKADTPLQFQLKSDQLLCSVGWVSFQNSCYLLVNVSGTWESANSSCHKQGAHLMVLNRKDELKFVLKIVHKRFDYWIGLKKDNNNKWSWVDGYNYQPTPEPTVGWPGLASGDTGLPGPAWPGLPGLARHGRPGLAWVVFWDVSETPHGGLESCVLLKGSGAVDGKLFHNVDCHSVHYYICEHKLETDVG
ncbi:hypothetical protein DNTS_015215 [Danionella cerebrum]|uniref:C-type lectin domain-containing protein n=1 Tax=Danionella cerebrum TaxID=2873325 RepID=A0A553NJH6_9TELE|nr:hypothetical protein DNTS_015215 [Danionella translucida]